MTTIEAHLPTPTASRAERLTRGVVVLLIGAPLLMAVGRVLLVPFDDEDWDAVLTSMANHQGRSDAGWLIAMAASGLLAVTAVILAHRLGVTGRTRAAMFATVTTAIGWASCAAICLGGLYLSVAATAPDRAVQVQLQKDFNSGASTGFVFLMALLGVIGYAVLAFGLARRARHHEGCGRAHRNRRSGHDHHHGRTVDAAARPHRAPLGRRSRPDDSLRGLREATAPVTVSALVATDLGKEG